MGIPRSDRETFYRAYRAEFGKVLTSSQKRGIDRLLSVMEASPDLPSSVGGIRQAAYQLATSKHETAERFMPIEEFGGDKRAEMMYGHMKSLGRRLGNDAPGEGAAYKGRGDVQVTGENNYERLEVAVKSRYPDVVRRFEAKHGKAFELTVGDQPNDWDDPDGALDEEVSAIALVVGTLEGWYGLKLRSVVNDRVCNYVRARGSVNGHDQDTKIAKYAEHFEDCLEAATRAATDPSPEPAAPTHPATPSVVTSEEVAAPDAAALDPTSVVSGAAAPSTVDTINVQSGGEVSVGPASLQAAVSGGDKEDPPVKANSQGLIGKILAWAGGATGVGAAVGTVMTYISSVSGLTERAQVIVVIAFVSILVVGLLVFGIIAAVAAVVDHIQTKSIRANPALQNVK